MSDALANPLLGDDSGLGNGLTAPTGNPRHFYQAGEDGNWYNDSGDRVYYWVPPSETDSTIRSGGETQGIGQDLGGYYTEAEIAQAYNADEGMGYLAENVSWDNYWGFISERQGEIQAGTLVDPIQGEFAKIGREQALENTDADADIANTGRDEEIYYGQLGSNTQVSQGEQMGAWVSQNSTLMNKYGIAGVQQNNDGDYFAFNGSTYSRIYKQEGVDWGQIVAGVMISAFMGFAGAEAGAWFAKAIPGLNLPGHVQTVAEIIAANGGLFGGTSGAAGTASDVIDGFNPNVIVNLAGANTTPNKPFQGDGEGVDSEGNPVWNTRNLPSIYSIINGDIVHTASGTVMSAGNYSANRTQYVSFPPYVDGDNDGGGTPASSSNTSSTSPTTSSSSSSSSDTSAVTGSSGNATSTGDDSNTTVLTNVNDSEKTTPYVNTPEIWDENGQYGRFVIVEKSDGAIWGQSGVFVVRDTSSGVWQTIDWNDKTFDKRDEEQAGVNPFIVASTASTTEVDTSGSDVDTDSTSATTSTPTVANPPPIPKPGDACELADGSTGTIDGGGACQPSTGQFVNGSWMVGIDTAYQTGVKPSNSCESGWEYGNGTCIPANSPHVPKSNPSNATATSSTASSSNTTSSSTTASTNTTSTSTTPSTSTSTTASTNTSNTTGTGTGSGNGDGDGDGDGDGNGNGNNGMLSGGIPGLRNGSKDSWSPLFPGYQFRKFNKDRGNRMPAPMTNSPNFQTRKSLVDGLWKEVMKR